MNNKNTNMVYAQIKDGKVKNTIILDSYDATFLTGFDYLVDVTSVSPVPGIGWSYNGSDFSKDTITLNDTQVLEKKYQSGEYDYTKFRSLCKATILPNFATLSIQEQTLLVKHFIYPDTFTQSDIDTLFSASEQYFNWKSLVAETKKARLARWAAAKTYVSFVLDELSAADIFITVEEFYPRYTEANRPDLILWVTNSAFAPLGIDYTTTGFAQKSYYSESLKGIIYDIIVNGNY